MEYPPTVIHQIAEDMQAVKEDISSIKGLLERLVKAVEGPTAEQQKTVEDPGRAQASQRPDPLLARKKP